MSSTESAGLQAESKRIALVTGATAGMGLEIARQLGAAGFLVLVGARDADQGAGVVTELQARGADADVVTLDVTDAASVAKAAERIGEKFGRLDVLVNNAGVSFDHGKMPTETTLDDFRRTYETNVFGVATVTNAMLPFLLKSHDGRIINQSAALGLQSQVARLEPPMVNLRMTAYSTSKGALNCLTLEYAKFLKDTSVRIYATSPGQVVTALNGYRAGGVTAAVGASVAVGLATQADPAPTGTLWGLSGQIAW